MRRTITAVAAAIGVIAALALSATASPSSQLPITRAGGEKIAGQYIVTVRRDSAAGAAAAVAAAVAADPLHTYRSAVRGFAAVLDAAQLRVLRRDPRVTRIEEDSVVRADTTQTNPPWGLDRIDQRSWTWPSRSYSYQHDGAGVHAYIIDTGIDVGHPEFGARASNVYDAFGGDGQDCNGHGTHVAGIVGAAAYGVAKRVSLRGVRVLDCNGSGTYAGVVAGVDWVASNHVAPAVANISLGGGYNATLNAAVTRMTEEGVVTAVSAGASNSDACNFSPASAANVITVVATDSSDTSASFNNRGSCVELYAPGVGIPSTWLSGGVATLSGSSMAAAHVTGAAAIYRQVDPTSSSAAVNDWIIAASTKGVVKKVPSGTPNRLLHKAPTL